MLASLSDIGIFVPLECREVDVLRETEPRERIVGHRDGCVANKGYGKIVENG